MLYQAKSFLCTISFSFHNNPMRYCDAHFPKRKLKLSKFSFPLWNYMAKSEARTPVELCPRKCGWANLPSKPPCGRMTCQSSFSITTQSSPYSSCRSQPGHGGLSSAAGVVGTLVHIPCPHHSRACWLAFAWGSLWLPTPTLPEVLGN